MRGCFDRQHEVSLTAAMDAAERSDFEVCLDALLDAWRARRTLPLGDAITRVSQIVAEGLAPPSPSDVEEVAGAILCLVSRGG